MINRTQYQNQKNTPVPESQNFPGESTESRLYESTAPITNVFQKDLKEGLFSEEGVDVFSRIIGSTLSQVVVSTRDLETQIKQNNDVTVLNEPKNLEKARISSSEHPRPTTTNAYAAPRNKLEQIIADLWETFLGIEQVGIHDDFFDLGGDSLLAVQLVDKLRKTLKTELSTNFLLDSPTIAGIAELITRTTSPNTGSDETPKPEIPSSLVQIQAGSFKQPLFLVHPVGGNVYLYRDLARYLGSEQPIYGIQALSSINRETEPLTQIGEMAKQYVKDLRVLQPEGPYLLGGSSFGGMVAFEMAQQLHAQGQKVALLAMMDTPSPNHMPVRIETDAEILAYMLSVGESASISSEDLSQLDSDEKLFNYFNQMKLNNRMLPNLDLDQLRQFLHLFRANLQAMFDYQPQVYPGSIIFFHARERDAFNHPNPEKGWIDFAGEGIEIQNVSGNHITMNYPPHVQILAERLRIHVQRARQLFI
jgi:thioesterase domain-containing protein/acyl carrier protein